MLGGVRTTLTCCSILRDLWLRYLPSQLTRCKTRVNNIQYIEGELAQKIGLLQGQQGRRKKAFITIENYVHMQNRLWTNDFHDYVHEGSRVDNSNLLNTHCFTSAPCQEVCQAIYQVWRPLVGKGFFADSYGRILGVSCHGKKGSQIFGVLSRGKY